MTKEKRKTFTIFSQRLAGMLMYRGFMLVGVGKQKNNPDSRDCYFFFDSPELQEAIKEYKKF